MEKSFVPTPAGRLAYLKAGTGQPMLLIHGIPTSSFLWRNVIPHLSEDFQVYAVDLLGYGDSDKPEDADLSIVAQARHLWQLMEKVGWRSGSVVGHDIGGGIAQLLTVEHPEAVAKLVLIDSIAYDSWPEPQIARLKEPVWDELMETLDLGKGLRRGFEKGMVHKERVDDELIAQYLRPFEGIEGRRAYLRCARALRTEDLTSVMDRVEQLDVSTLIIWGAADPYQDVRYGQRLAGSMRRARLVVEQAGHFIQEDRPREVALLIGDFVMADP